MFKVNDLIDIHSTTLPLNIFNDEKKYGTRTYQRISRVDILKNTITVENATRRGPYFIRRAELEKIHYGDTRSCINEVSDGIVPDDIDLNYSCDFKDLYKHCSEKDNNQTACNGGDGLCQYSDGCVSQAETGTDDLNGWMPKCERNATDVCVKSAVEEQCYAVPVTEAERYTCTPANHVGFIWGADANACAGVTGTALNDSSACDEVMSLRHGANVPACKYTDKEVENPTRCTLIPSADVADATCTETAPTTVAADATACASVTGTALTNNTACDAVQLAGTSDGTSPACTYTPAITLNPGSCDFLDPTMRGAVDASNTTIACSSAIDTTTAAADQKLACEAVRDINSARVCGYTPAGQGTQRNAQCIRSPGSSGLCHVVPAATVANTEIKGACAPEENPNRCFPKFRNLPHKESVIWNSGRSSGPLENFKCNEVYQDYHGPLERTKCRTIRPETPATSGTILKYENMLSNNPSSSINYANQTYSLPVGEFSDLDGIEEDYLKGWRVTYLAPRTGGVTEKEGMIINNVLRTHTDNSKYQDIKIQKPDENIEDTTGIYILSVRVPELSISDINVKIFARKGISVKGCYDDISDALDPLITTATACPTGKTWKYLPFKCYDSNGTDITAADETACTGTVGHTWEPDRHGLINSTTKKECDYNNGTWDNDMCDLASVAETKTGKIRTVDLCERTGFRFDKKSNVCYKETTTQGSTGQTLYCGTKVSRDATTGEKTVWDSDPDQSKKHPCGVCKFEKDIISTSSETIQKCSALPRSECTSKLSETSCNASKSCEYYRDNMDVQTVEKSNGENVAVSNKQFRCIQGAIQDQPDCASITRLALCEGTDEKTGCDWTCPLITRTGTGYIAHVSSDTGMVTLATTNLNEIAGTGRPKYYSASDISLSCDDGWEHAVTGQEPSAVCVKNTDDDTYANHKGIMAFSGCVKSLKCKNPEYRPDDLGNLTSDNIPASFKTNGDLDLKKSPDNEGNFQCPEPTVLKSSPENKDGWDEASCCESVGLCSGNTNPTNDLICPSGQAIKMMYYENNDILLAVKGDSVAECCEAAGEPTVSIPLDADYDTLIGYKGSSVSEEFKSNFISDLVSIINSSPHTGTTSFDASLIEILGIEKGSIIVHFKIKRNSLGEVILQEQLTKTFATGTAFPRLNSVVKGDLYFGKKLEECIYQNEELKICITPESGKVILAAIICFICIFVTIVTMAVLS